MTHITIKTKTFNIKVLSASLDKFDSWEVQHLDSKDNKELQWVIPLAFISAIISLGKSPLESSNLFEQSFSEWTVPSWFLVKFSRFSNLYINKHRKDIMDEGDFMMKKFSMEMFNKYFILEISQDLNETNIPNTASELFWN